MMRQATPNEPLCYVIGHTTRGGLRLRIEVTEHGHEPGDYVTPPCEGWHEADVMLDAFQDAWEPSSRDRERYNDWLASMDSQAILDHVWESQR